MQKVHDWRWWQDRNTTLDRWMYLGCTYPPLTNTNFDTSICQYRVPIRYQYSLSPIQKPYRMELNRILFSKGNMRPGTALALKTVSLLPAVTSLKAETLNFMTLTNVDQSGHDQHLICLIRSVLRWNCEFEDWTQDGTNIGTWEIKDGEGSLIKGSLQSKV